MTLDELIAARDAAISEYASKLPAFRSAFVELAALDIALGSPRIGHQAQRPGFGTFPDVTSFRHAFAAPDFGGSFAEDVNSRVDQIMRRYRAPAT